MIFVYSFLWINVSLSLSKFWRIKLKITTKEFLNRIFSVTSVRIFVLICNVINFLTLNYVLFA